MSIVSDLESVLTGYCKSTGIPYETGCGWLEVLQPLVTLKVSAGQLYQCFRSILKDYVPRDVNNPEGLPFHIFRLLLLYHDPQLCSLLDSKRITPYLYCSSWVSLSRNRRNRYIHLIQHILMPGSVIPSL